MFLWWHLRQFRKRPLHHYRRVARHGRLAVPHLLSLFQECFDESRDPGTPGSTLLDGIVLALGSIRDPAAAEPLSRLLRRARGSTAQIAATALYAIGWKPSSLEDKLLLKYYYDEGTHFSMGGSRSWFRQDFDRFVNSAGPAAVPALARLIRLEPRDDVIPQLLGQLKTPEAVDPLIDALKDAPDRVTYVKALVALAPDKDTIRAVLPVLLERLRQYPECRYVPLLLSDLDAADAVGPLIAALKKSASNLACVEALAKLAPNKETLQLLLEACPSSTHWPFGFFEAMQPLTALGPEPFLNLLNDERYALAACNAIERLGLAEVAAPSLVQIYLTSPTVPGNALIPRLILAAGRVAITYLAPVISSGHRFDLSDRMHHLRQLLRKLGWQPENAAERIWAALIDQRFNDLAREDDLYAAFVASSPYTDNSDLPGLIHVILGDQPETRLVSELLPRVTNGQASEGNTPAKSALKALRMILETAAPKIADEQLRAVALLPNEVKVCYSWDGPGRGDEYVSASEMQTHDCSDCKLLAERELLSRRAVKCDGRPTGG